MVVLELQLLFGGQIIQKQKEIQNSPVSDEEKAAVEQETNAANQSLIKDTLENYEPRIIIEKVQTSSGEARDFFGDQSNEIRVKIEFYIIQN